MTEEEIVHELGKLRQQVSQLNDYVAQLTKMKRELEMGGSLAPPTRTNSSRGDPGPAGTTIWNSDQGQLNISTGTQWTTPDGAAA